MEGVSCAFFKKNFEDIRFKLVSNPIPLWKYLYIAVDGLDLVYIY